MKVDELTPGTRVRWTPERLPYWGRGDTWSNEFSCAWGTELGEAQWDAYLAWSKHEVTGVVVSAPTIEDGDEFFAVLLDRSPLVIGVVAYPRDAETTDVFTVVEWDA